MNLSPAEVALVPPDVLTVTSTVPVPLGAVAVIEVAESAVTVAAGHERDDYVERTTQQWGIRHHWISSSRGDDVVGSESRWQEIDSPGSLR